LVYCTSGSPLDTTPHGHFFAQFFSPAALPHRPGFHGRIIFYILLVITPAWFSSSPSSCRNSFYGSSGMLSEGTPRLKTSVVTRSDSKEKCLQHTLRFETAQTSPVIASSSALKLTFCAQVSGRNSVSSRSNSTVFIFLFSQIYNHDKLTCCLLSPDNSEKSEASFV